MATFHTGQQTHQAVLPQRSALEPASAVTPGNRDGTGRGDHVRPARWALWRALDERQPARVCSGGRTRWNRNRDGLPKPHTPHTPRGLVTTTGKNPRLLQRADGYGYTTQKEVGAFPPV